MKTYKTEQEEFWSGEFGDEYINRNSSDYLLASNIALFSDIIKNCDSKINDVIEFGCNIGMNLKALKNLCPTLKCAGVEINSKAAAILKQDAQFENNIDVYEESILDFETDKQYDLSMIKGVLIHINPSELKSVYRKLYNASKKYMIICEYYNPTPMEVLYRGNKGKLFKRDFAGEFLDMFPDVSLVNYGFVYHRDNVFPQDDITWFLLKK